MTFIPGRICTPLTEDAYQARMSDFHREARKGRKVNCPICQEELAVGSLKGHLASQHDHYQCFLAPDSEQEGSETGQKWKARFYPEEGTFRCPVPG